MRLAATCWRAERIANPINPKPASMVSQVAGSGTDDTEAVSVPPTTNLFPRFAF